MQSRWVYRAGLALLLALDAGCLVRDVSMPDAGFDAALGDRTEPFDMGRAGDSMVVIVEDSGAPDAPTQGIDAVAPPADHSPIDVATPVEDSSVRADSQPDSAMDSPVDTGVGPADTGVGPIDTGVAPTDTGVSPMDTGVAPMDTGVAPADTGVVADTGAMSDTGVAPADTGIIRDTGVGNDGSRDVAGDGDVHEPPSSLDYCARITDRTPVTMYLASDDSNSVASPQIARRLITTGVRVPAEVIRTHEFMNYYNPRFAPAPAGAVAITGALRPIAGSGQWDMQVAVQSESRTMTQVAPMVITFLIDTSASMSFERMSRAQAVIRAIAAQLRPGDVVSAAGWNVTARTLLDGVAVSGPNDPRVLAMADSLRATWEDTDLARGLTYGYALAMAHRTRAKLNRLVLISDGEANVGATSAETIGRPARDQINGEIHLVGVSVGDGVNDTLMDRVTDLGRGASLFIDRPEEAAVMFGPRFIETMDIAVRAVRLELELPWYMRVFATSAESISGTPTLVEPQYLSPNDAMVFQQVLQACSPTISAPTDVVRMRATFQDRTTLAARSVSADSTMGAMMGAPEAALRKGAAIVAFAEALKISDLGDRATALAAIDAAIAVVTRARALADDDELREINALLVRHREFRRLL